MKYPIQHYVILFLIATALYVKFFYVFNTRIIIIDSFLIHVISNKYYRSRKTVSIVPLVVNVFLIDKVYIGGPCELLIRGWKTTILVDVFYTCLEKVIQFVYGFCKSVRDS